MIDPVTLAVLNGRTEQIADEMDATLFRAAGAASEGSARRGAPGGAGRPRRGSGNRRMIVLTDAVLE